MAVESSVTFLVVALNLHLLLKRRGLLLRAALDSVLIFGGVFYALTASHILPNFLEIPVPMPVQSPAHQVRMAVGSAITFAFWGLCSLLLNHRFLPLRFRRSRAIAAALCGATVTGIGCLCLLYAFLGIYYSQVWIWSVYVVQIAPETAILFIVLGLLGCGLGLRRGRFRGGQFNFAAGLLLSYLVLVLFLNTNVTLSLGLNDALQHRDRVKEADDSIRRLNGILSSLRQAESGQRGFLLTGKRDYLMPYYDGRKRALLFLRMGNLLVGSHRSHEEQLLREVSIAKLQELEATVNAYLDGNRRYALHIVESDRGENLMRQAKEICDRGRAALEERSRIANGLYWRATDTVRKTVYSSYVLAFCLLGCTVLMFRQEIRRRGRIEHQLRLHELNLEARIHARTADLSASEARYRALLDQSPVAVHILDRNGNHVLINPAFERLFGLTNDQLANYNVWRASEPQRNGIAAMLKRTYAGELSFAPAFYHDPSRSLGIGRPATIETTAYPVRSDDLDVREVVLLCHDVTDREKALASMRSSERHFRQLAETVPMMVWTARADGTLDYYSERWFEFSGFSRDLREEERWIDLVHDEDKETLLQTWANSIASGQTYELDFRLWDKKEQQYRWFLSRAVPAKDELGHITRWFGITTDIQEQKEAESLLEAKVKERTLELQNSYNLLQSSEEALRVSLAEREILFKELHHRVKNNLQVISSLLRMQGDSLREQPAAAAALEESRRRVQSMSLIHERLYSLGNVDLIEFGDYADVLVRELIYSSQLPNREITHSLRLDKVLLDVVQAIPLGLILNELVINALKYAFVNRPEGIIQITLTESAIGEVTLAVSDNGVGLPSRFKPKQMKSLGIPIVEILVRQLGGKFEWRTSDGAHFTVRFPSRQPCERAA